MSGAHDELEQILRAVQSAVMGTGGTGSSVTSGESSAEESTPPLPPPDHAAPAAVADPKRLQLYRQYILQRLTRAICSSLGTVAKQVDRLKAD